MSSFKKIDVNQVTLDPIQNFNKLIIDQIPNIIDKYFSDYLSSNKNVYDQYNDYDNKISQNYVDIQSKKRELKIIKRKVENFFIGTGFCFIIGLIWFKKYKNNKLIIQEFNTYENKLKQKNKKYEKSKKTCIKQFFYNFDFNKIIDYFCQNVGIQYNNYLSNDEYAFLLKLFGFKFISCCNKYFYKTSPIYDFSYYKLNYRIVTTQKSCQYTYPVQYTRSDGSTYVGTATETLTAYHSENTPFLDYENNIIFLTNFDKELSFSFGNKKYLKLENNQFNKIYKLNNNSNNINTSLLQFFTIKSQEDFVNWYIYKNKSVNLNFSKSKNILKIGSYDCSFNHFINELNIYNLFNLSNNIANIFSEIKDNVISYFTNLIDSITMPLLSSTINREMYSSTNQNYKIFTNYDSKINTDVIHSYEYLLSKLNKNEIIRFISNTPKKESWINIINVECINNIYYLKCQLESFYSKRLYDSVMVSGASGSHIIQVPYDKFYPIKEIKNIVHIPFINTSMPSFAITKNIKFNIFSSLKDDALKPFAKFNLWTNNLNYFSQNLNNVSLIEFLSNINSFIEDNISLFKDDSGYFIINNYPDKLNNEKIDNIINIINSFIR